MSDDAGPPDAPQRSVTTVHCNQCGNDVPRTEYCVRCGDPLSDEYSSEGRVQARRRYAAAPNEPLATIAFVSTLFPQLPRAEMRTFRIAFIGGAAIIAVLALLGFTPVALVSAAVLVPLLMVVYLYVVDIYEDEPLSIIGATMFWGAAAGIVYALFVRALPAGGASLGDVDTGTIFVSGIALPTFELVLMLAGPLFLLPRRRFNDVLDGVTFGAAAAVAFAGAHVIVQSLPMLGAGLRPAGDPLPWLVQLLSLGVFQPVLAAGAVGATAAAFWLRYRSPVGDRNALGLAGHPLVAVIAAALLFIAAGLAGVLLALIPATIVIGVLAAVALLWLRNAIHLGLSQEAREVPLGRSITCPNCGHTTPLHTFCGHCGISLQALPKSGRASVDPTRTDRSAQ